MKKCLVFLLLTTFLYSCSNDEASQNLDQLKTGSTSKITEQTAKDNNISTSNSSEDPSNPDTGLSLDPGQEHGGGGTTCETKLLTDGNCTAGIITATKHLDSCYGLILTSSYSTDGNGKITFQDIHIRFDNNQFAFLSQYQIFDAYSKDVTVHITYKFSWLEPYTNPAGFTSIRTVSENRFATVRINVCDKTIN